jgi:hypothetical protein
MDSLLALSRKVSGFRSLLAAALMLGSALAIATPAAAQVTPPSTPDFLTPQDGSTPFLLGSATGTQGYVCLPTSTGASWTVNGARPEATLFTTVFGQQVEIITHFLSPNTNPNQFAPNPLPFGNATWQSSLDSSKVWAQATGVLPASSDQVSCPHTGSIPCLLLQVIGAERGPAGGRSLIRTTFIQRLNTNGGAAPVAGCSSATDVGKQALVPYSADYYFWKQ